MRSAFTLVELSIVIVVIGLLTGGILAGQSLIRASALRSTTTQMENIVAATNTFISQYNYYPGDMPNATDYWGAVKAGGGCDTTTAFTGTLTCNGDGDGLLDIAGGANQYAERFTFWNHLVNAGLMAGEFTGRTGSTNTAYYVAGVNSPKTKISGSMFRALYLGTDPWGSEAIIGNQIELCGGEGTFASASDILTPKEHWKIDTKVDDGMPATGRIYTWTDAGGCTTTADLDTAEYNVSNGDVDCKLARDIDQ